MDRAERGEATTLDHSQYGGTEVGEKSQVGYRIPLGDQGQEKNLSCVFGRFRGASPSHGFEVQNRKCAVQCGEAMLEHCQPAPVVLQRPSGLRT